MAKIKTIITNNLFMKDMIAQVFNKNNLLQSISSTSVTQYIDIIELAVYKINTKVVFFFKIPLTEIYVLYQLYPIPVLDNRTDFIIFF